MQSKQDMVHTGCPKRHTRVVIIILVTVWVEIVVSWTVSKNSKPPTINTEWARGPLTLQFSMKRYVLGITRQITNYDS